MPSPDKPGTPNINHELANIIVDSRYGMMLSRNRETRLLRIAEIASLYTRQELLRERGFGVPAVASVQRWLTRHGRRLRDRHEPIEAAICRLDIGGCRARTLQAESVKHVASPKAGRPLRRQHQTLDAEFPA
jgi:hypothetical protein